MRIRELEDSEDVAERLAATLATFWGDRGEGVNVLTRDPGDGAPWLSHPMLYGLFHPNLADPVRRWLRQEARNTTRRLRAPAQWIVGTALTFRASVTRGASPLLWTSPPLEGQEHMLLLVGAHRVRLLDFGRGESLLMLKDGAHPRHLTREIVTRQETGPWFPLGEVGERGGWLSEPLMSGSSLPRVGDASRRASAQTEALRGLRTWQMKRHRLVASEGYAQDLRAQVRSSLASMDDEVAQAMTADLEGPLDRLTEGALRRPEVVLTTSHGDLQPGNIFVPRDGSPAVLVDFEYCLERSASHDWLCWGLEARPMRPGLDGRVARFVERGETRDDVGVPMTDGDPASRQSAVCWFFLEEVARLLEDRAERPPAAHDPVFNATLRAIHGLTDP